VAQPNAGHWSSAILGKIDSPNQTCARVSNKNPTGTDQAAAIQRPRFIGEDQNLLRLDRITGPPVAQINTVKTRFVIRCY